MGNPSFAGYRFFEQFVGDRFAPSHDMSSSYWFTAVSLASFQSELIRASSPEEWENLAEIEEAVESITESDFLEVYYPVTAIRPATHEPDKTYDSGIYTGWILVVERESLQNYCFARFARFAAFSSETVATDGVKIVGMTFDNFKEVVQEDFQSNFRTAAHQAKMRILSGRAHDDVAGAMFDDEIEEVLRP